MDNFNFNYSCKKDSVPYDATSLYNTNPKDDRVKLMSVCDQFGDFSVNSATDCPKNSYLNFGCVDQVGRDLLCNELITPPRERTQVQIALDQSTLKKWSSVSQEACVSKRLQR